MEISLGLRLMCTFMYIFNELKNILLDPYASYSFNCILFRINLLHLTLFTLVFKTDDKSVL